jgi:imidazolonepropionase-like amidohydrolase
MRLFQKENPWVSPHEILSLATVKPAEALGMGRQLGRIKPGYLADLIGVPLASSPKAGKGDLVERVMNYKGTVSFAMVHGEPRFRLTS